MALPLGAGARGPRVQRAGPTVPSRLPADTGKRDSVIAGAFSTSLGVHRTASREVRGVSCLGIELPQPAACNQGWAVQIISVAAATKGGPLLVCCKPFSGVFSPVFAVPHP